MVPPETPWWPNVVTWLLVLGGWYVVHLATLSRERRKEQREAVNDVIESLGALEQEAREFHTASPFDPYKADTIRYKTEKIILRLQRRPLNELKVPLTRMIRLRKSITLSNTDPSSFKPQDVGSPILRDIRAAVDDLRESIEIAREARWY